MTASRSLPPDLHSVPTLTEVIAMPAVSRPAAAEVPIPTLESALVTEADANVRAAPQISEEELVERVLADVQRQADQMLEYRLREALTPVLERLSEALVGDVRRELASTLRDVVSRSVAQELARHRGR